MNISLRITNVVYKGKLPYRFDLEKLAEMSNQLEMDIYYDPFEFPGAKIKPRNHSKIKNILLFANGSIVVNATDLITEEELLHIINKIIELGVARPVCSSSF